MKRKDLIAICEKAVVHFDKWHDRDSNAAQINLNSIYQGLKAGVNYTIRIETSTIWVDFKQPTAKQLVRLNSFSLPISTLEDYRAKYGYENEMFESDPIDFENDYRTGYLPTQERLNSVKGGDWY